MDYLSHKSQFVSLATMNTSDTVFTYTETVCSRCCLPCIPLSAGTPCCHVIVKMFDDSSIIGCIKNGGDSAYCE